MWCRSRSLTAVFKSISLAICLMVQFWLAHTEAVVPYFQCPLPHATCGTLPFTMHTYIYKKIPVCRLSFVVCRLSFSSRFLSGHAALAASKTNGRTCTIMMYMYDLCRSVRPCQRMYCTSTMSRMWDMQLRSRSNCSESLSVYRRST